MSANRAQVSRRSAISAAAVGTVAVGVGGLVGTAAGDEAKRPELWTLEGELKVHPKFVYRYYLVLLDGQKCALYGADHSREIDQLARLRLPARVRVRGVLGTDHHAGGTQNNPSPFPEGWWVYMDVHEITTPK
jgi:hypothetical protein